MSGVGGRCQKKQRCGPLRRTQGSPRSPMKIIGKTTVFSCPHRWNTVCQTGPLGATWEILRLFEIIGKALENPCFAGLSIIQNHRESIGETVFRHLVGRRFQNKKTRPLLAVQSRRADPSACYMTPSSAPISGQNTW